MAEENSKKVAISNSMEKSIAKAMDLMLDEIYLEKNTRVLVRPKESVLKGLIPIIMYFSLLITALVNSDVIANALSITTKEVVFLIFAVFVIAAIVCLKPLAIWMILMYQRFAPTKVRMACFFEPSCSEYMKLAIEKYGLIRGIIKGCDRLGRCHFPNHGKDYP